MAVRKLKPTSAGRRLQILSDFAEITRSTPEKSLTEGLPRKSGRNNNGRVTSRRRGGGPRRDAGQVGGEISRDPQAVDGRVGTVHTVPGL